MIKNLLRANLLFCIIILISGCATTVQWAPRIDGGHNFDLCPVDKACIYVVRPKTDLGSGLMIKVLDNNTAIGTTAPGTYLAWSRAPGVAHIESRGENTAQIEFSAAAGHTYYISQALDFMDQNTIWLITKEQAVKHLNSCKPAVKNK